MSPREELAYLQKQPLPMGRGAQVAQDKRIVHLTRVVFEEDHGKLQELTMDTIMGPRPILAPAGWQFDKTATLVWSRLLHYARERKKGQRIKRDEYVLEGQIEALAQILASSLGMASFYWSQKARAIAEAGVI